MTAVPLLMPFTIFSPLGHRLVTYGCYHKDNQGGNPFYIYVSFSIPLFSSCQSCFFCAAALAGTQPEWVCPLC